MSFWKNHAGTALVTSVVAALLGLTGIGGLAFAAPHSAEDPTLSIDPASAVLGTAEGLVESMLGFILGWDWED